MLEITSLVMGFGTEIGLWLNSSEGMDLRNLGRARMIVSNVDESRKCFDSENILRSRMCSKSSVRNHLRRLSAQLDETSLSQVKSAFLGEFHAFSCKQTGLNTSFSSS